MKYFKAFLYSALFFMFCTGVFSLFLFVATLDAELSYDVTMWNPAYRIIWFVCSCLLSLMCFLGVVEYETK